MVIKEQEPCSIGKEDRNMSESLINWSSWSAALSWRRISILMTNLTIVIEKLNGCKDSKTIHSWDRFFTLCEFADPVAGSEAGGMLFCSERKYLSHPPLSPKDNSFCFILSLFYPYYHRQIPKYNIVFSLPVNVLKSLSNVSWPEMHLRGM